MLVSKGSVKTELPKLTEEEIKKLKEVKDKTIKDHKIILK